MNTLFYDGNCAFCSASVKFCLRRDKEKHLYYAPLGGKMMLEKKIPSLEEESIIVLTQDDVLLYKSDAVIYLLKIFGSYWKVLAYFMQLFPLKLRNWVYDFVARHRYKIAGKLDRQDCMLLSKEDQKRVLE
jgi:predicted DCC family thiol-disulfide oxidoreductase YuxK